jgi:alginate O-acetyltransferase complex protein AlgI
MLFNSISFLIFFPITTAIYFALPHRFRWVHLLLVSCLFYMAFVPAYILILLGTIAVDYAVGLAIEGAAGARRKAFLAMSIVANVGVLAAFKYWDFLGANFNDLARALHWNYSLGALRMLLPIGLSFHTFQAMSYTIEVYRGRPAERHLGIYALYVMFYPQLVAGPIERPQNLLHQFREHHHFDYERVTDGLRQMLWGFFKKLVVADRMSTITDAVFSRPHAFGPGRLLLATYCFTLQIYCDFSGYSDIALGTARVLGFKLMNNFDRPYLAVTVAEFWRRWHISLSTWFKDYLYIPLGGSRTGTPRHCRNLLIIFLLSGFWHGASWTFIAWGALHGSYMIAHVFTAPLRARLAGRAGIDRDSPPMRLVRWFITFNLVAVAWVFFRADTVTQACWIVRRLPECLLRPVELTSVFHPMPTELYGDNFTSKNLGLVIVVIVLAAAGHAMHKGHKPLERLRVGPVWVRWGVYYAIILSILWLGDLGARSFIYFQF